MCTTRLLLVSLEASQRNVSECSAGSLLVSQSEDYSEQVKLGQTTKPHVISSRYYNC